MRHIGTVSDPDLAELFADYLAAKGISATTNGHGSNWSIWVRDEDQREASRNELDRFLIDSTNPEYSRLAEETRKARAPVAPVNSPAAVPALPAQPLTMRDVAVRAPLTFTIIMLTTFVAISSQLGQDIRSSAVESLAFCHPNHLHEPAWIDEENGIIDIRRGEIWRLVTPSFLHFGIAHIGLNLFFLFQLGWLFELRHSTARMGLVLLVSAIVGNIGQYLCDGWPLFGGLSGAVCGLVAYMWMRMRIAPNEGLKISPIGVLLVMLALGLAGSLDQVANDTMGNDIKIANWSQIFGMASGALLALALPLLPQTDDPAASESPS